jgi:type I restriction enzyme R subunit
VGFGNGAGGQAVRGDAGRAVDEIVRIVRFPGWQSTIAGEREVKLALRKTLWKYKLHQDQDLFDRAYAYIKEYY